MSKLKILIVLLCFLSGSAFSAFHQYKEEEGGGHGVGNGGDPRELYMIHITTMVSQELGIALRYPITFKITNSLESCIQVNLPNADFVQIALDSQCIPQVLSSWESTVFVAEKLVRRMEEKFYSTFNLQISLADLYGSRFDSQALALAQKIKNRFDSDKMFLSDHCEIYLPEFWEVAETDSQFRLLENTFAARGYRIITASDTTQNLRVTLSDNGKLQLAYYRGKFLDRVQADGTIVFNQPHLMHRAYKLGSLSFRKLSQVLLGAYDLPYCSIRLK